MWRSVEDGNSEIKEVLKEGHNEKDVGSLDHVDVIRICRCTNVQGARGCIRRLASREESSLVGSLHLRPGSQSGVGI